MSCNRLRCIKWLFIFLFSFSHSIAATTLLNDNSQNSVEWFSVYLAGKKSGFSKIEREILDQEVTTTMTTSMQIHRGNDVVSINSVERSVETLEGEAIRFQYSQTQGSSETLVEGDINENGTADIKITSGGTVSQHQQQWDPSALLSEGQRLRMMSAMKTLNANKKPLEAEGSHSIHFSMKAYETSSAEIVPTEVEMTKGTFVELLGSVVKLTEQKQLLTFGSNSIEVKSYWDDQFQLKKMVWPLMGTTLEIISTTAAHAQSPNEKTSFFTQVFTPSPSFISSEQLKGALEYKIIPKHEQVRFLNTAEQQLNEAVEGSKEITIQVQPILNAMGEFPYKGNDQDIRDYLKPNRWVQSDNREIIDLAQTIIVETESAGQAAKAIENYVRDFIEEKTLSVGYASALEVLRTKEGDCTEHALLAVALLKAVGIPARVVTGLAYADRFAGQEQVFVPHAWAQAYIDQQWVSFDAALNGFDSSHITLSVGKGDPFDFFDVLNTLGNFEITSVSTK